MQSCMAASFYHFPDDYSYSCRKPAQCSSQGDGGGSEDRRHKVFKQLELCQWLIVPHCDADSPGNGLQIGLAIHQPLWGFFV